MKTEIDVAKVNYSAIGTWLEPYIGWEFKIKKRGKKVVWFYMDKGSTLTSVEKYDIKVFDFIQLTDQLI